MIGYILPALVSPPVGFVFPRVLGRDRAYLAACVATCFRVDAGDPEEAHVLYDVACRTAASIARPHNQPRQEEKQHLSALFVTFGPVFLAFCPK